MAHRNGNHRLKRPPSSNGDPFQAFVIQELMEQRRYRREQNVINKRLRMLIDSVSGRVEKLTRTVDGLSRRMDRQDRINRLTLKEFKFLRRRLR